MILKKIIKRMLSLIFGSSTFFKLMRQTYFRFLFPYIQVVTYHDTSIATSSSLKAQLDFFKDEFVNCSLSDLQRLVSDGVWNHNKPGLIITFDDGLRSNFDVALPLLEEYGFSGWFMIPSGFIETDSKKQIEFANKSLIDIDCDSTTNRIALSWDEVREIDLRGHTVTCHSMSHRRLCNELSQQELEFEIKDAKKLLESQLGHTVDLFTWVGGEEWAYGRGAFDLMKEVGFNYIFCTNCMPIVAKQSPFFLQRYHVETDYDVNQLRFVLGGFYDFIYSWKRRRIEKNLKK